MVAADSEHARRIAARLREVSGVSPVVVLHQDPKAAAKLAAFTNSSEPWIVAVNMVSEGVDIPRLRVGVYATAAKTPLIFRQIVGRFVRTIPGRAARAELALHPGRHDPARSRRQRRAGAALRCCGSGARTRSWASSTRSSGARPRSGEVLDFEPLSADVAPQMTLFGPAPTRAGQSRRGGRAGRQAG